MSAQAKAMLLYRTILKEHKNRLPMVMRNMGNAYLKNEFSLHKTAKPEQVSQFYDAWEAYLANLRHQGSQFGADMNTNSLNAEQRLKLEQLKDETKKLGKE